MKVPIRVLDPRELTPDTRNKAVATEDEVQESLPAGVGGHSPERLRRRSEGSPVRSGEGGEGLCVAFRAGGHRPSRRWEKMRPEYDIRSREGARPWGEKNQGVLFFRWLVSKYEQLMGPIITR